MCRVDCFPCATAKRRVELELVAEGVDAAEIAQRVSAIRCAMCSEAERQQATRARQSRP